MTAELCNAATSRLVFVDIQARLAAAMAEGERRRVLDHAGALARAAAELEVPRLVTRQYPRGLGETEPELAELLPEAPTVDKTGFSCCRADGFEAALGDSEQIILAGMETHVCITQTALELAATGRTVFVAADAVCSRDPANHERALARLAHAGVGVTVTESILFEWLRDAGHDRFKAVTALLPR
jgi:nicotinamidase-related amidase